VAHRVFKRAKTLEYVRFLQDFPVFDATNVWSDIGGIQSRADPKVYAVQTATEALKRCILMTTDPGDLVLDPTCGSGTTAYVAEQWGRRWITCDTSRVALAIARHRLMTGAYDYYRLRHEASGVAGGFVYKTVPHITLKSIAQNTEIDAVAAEFEPQIAEALKSVNQAFGKEWQEWEVPRGMPESDKDRADLPGGSLQTRMKAINDFWRLKREMQERIDASIQRNAPQEELVDQPEAVRGVVRVTGPFTMESIPHPGDISAEAVDTKIVEGEDGLLTECVELLPKSAPPQEANAAAYVADMVEKLRRTGVHVKGGRKITFDSLRPLDHEVVHAEGEFTVPEAAPAEGELTPDEAAMAGKTVRCAVIFGPQNGAISENHVRDATRAAAPYDAVLFCGYDFTAPAQDVINSDPIPGKRLLMAYVNPDTAMGDLLKDQKASQIFTLVGEPDIVVYQHGDEALAGLLADAKRRGVAGVAKRAAKLQAGEMFIELRGVDVYDPLSGETASDSGANVHAFFIDQDYNGKSFCICQALFPNKADSWAKIARNLKGTIDEDAFEAMRTLVSLPFKPGEQKQVQVKVIDTRGNSVVKTVRV
jgi:adenine-specific DNA-methyltransferase